MSENLILFSVDYPWAVPAIAFVFGSVFGSFLNLVVYRLPKMMMRDWHGQAVEIIEEIDTDPELSKRLRSGLDEEAEPFNLAVPNSKCPNCQSAIRPWHNIPILGWIILKGRCADCSEPISARYPIVEFVTALLTMLVIIKFGSGWQGLAASAFTWALIALALIDFDTQLLPDDITLPFLWFGLIANFFGLYVAFDAAFYGAIAGYTILWTVYQVFKLVTGREGMGFGDFKMLAMLGAWLGVAMIPLIIILSSVAGAIFGGVLMMTGWARDKPIKFGPFLAVAGWVALMWGDHLISMYLEYAFSDV